jgi:hypothetical protein
MGWDVISLFGPSNLATKNQEQRYTMALGGHQTQIKMQQPTKNTRARRGKTRGLDGEEMRNEARLAGSTGGARFDCFRAIELGYSVNN